MPRDTQPDALADAHIVLTLDDYADHEIEAAFDYVAEWDRGDRFFRIPPGWNVHTDFLGAMIDGEWLPEDAAAARLWEIGYSMGRVHSMARQIAIDEMEGSQ